jgi:sepiapterin reductase
MHNCRQDCRTHRIHKQQQQVLVLQVHYHYHQSHAAIMTILLVVSGASRGFGQAVAVAFATSFFNASSSVSSRPYSNDDQTNAPIVMRIILTGRNVVGLRETKERIVPILYADTLNCTDTSECITIHPMDLGDLDTLETHMDDLINAARPLDRYERIVIINNAGSLGPLGKVTNIKSLQEFSQAIQLNVTSSLWFTTKWVKELFTTSQPNNQHVATTIVNISSLCAIEPFPTMTTYCVGKAARDMFHQSLAKEEQQHAAFKVLNYAPGAMDTDMTLRLRGEEQLDTSLQEYYRDAHSTGELIHPNTSAAKLVRLVMSGDFTSGAHVDYWDLPDI